MCKLTNTHATQPKEYTSQNVSVISSREATQFYLSALLQVFPADVYRFKPTTWGQGASDQYHFIRLGDPDESYST